MCTRLSSFSDENIDLTVVNGDFLHCSITPFSPEENVVVISFISQPQSQYFGFALFWKVANIVNFKHNRVKCYFPVDIIQQVSAHTSCWKSKFTVNNLKIDIKCNRYEDRKDRKSLYQVCNVTIYLNINVLRPLHRYKV